MLKVFIYIDSKVFYDILFLKSWLLRLEVRLQTRQQTLIEEICCKQPIRDIALIQKCFITFL